MSHPQTIQLGFEVSSGKPVEIPVRHMVVAGQTQEAGKTTTLEALIHRGGLKAIAFKTKRGEKAFGPVTGRITNLRPYFRERADWQFVASVLEAAMREKLKFERAWIINASNGAKTLAEVQKNVRNALFDARGLSASIYTTLDAYLDIVVPRIAKIDFARQLELKRGINVMDLADRDNFPAELQSLVMRSCLEWIYEREEKTIAIIPEAWEFLPQSRSSPVKLAAIELMRKGATLQNLLWLDSQDIGGIDKEFLRQVPVWLLGVQRETNEIKRTLSNIPAGITRPSAGDIAHLERGQFFACWGKHVVKTYVWPVWLGEESARLVAQGKEQAPGPVIPTRRPGGWVSQKPVVIKQKEREDNVTEAEAKTLRAENAQLKQRIEELENTLEELRKEPESVKAAAPIANTENLYQSILARLLKEPAIIELQTTRPELRMRETREVVELDGKSLRGRLAGLVHAGWFDEPKVGNAAFNELQRLGFSTAKPNVYKECDKLAEMGFLTKESTGYQAVAGMKRNIVRA